MTTDDDAEPYGETPGLTTCVAFDTTKNAQWGTPATGQGCIGTLYAYVEGWKY
ncbi:MAG TPA: hypothetical protein VFS67_17560 [Polyangiaceae bacterium]|nr:hypothetical protein [Polyangiaceae bacterium]